MGRDRSGCAESRAMGSSGFFSRSAAALAAVTAALGLAVARRDRAGRRRIRPLERAERLPRGAGLRRATACRGAASARASSAPSAVAACPPMGRTCMSPRAVVGSTAASSFGSVAVLKRDPATGAISEVGCLSFRRDRRTGRSFGRLRSHPLAARRRRRRGEPRRRDRVRDRELLRRRRGLRARSGHGPFDAPRLLSIQAVRRDRDARRRTCSRARRPWWPAPTARRST